MEAMNELQENYRDMGRATIASVSVAVVLIVIKLVAYVLTGSVAILATLIDSMLDFIASLINYYAVKHSMAPADREHRFGHGKAESLAGLGQSAFIAGSGLFLIVEAGGRLLEPRPVTNTTVGVTVMIISIVLTLLLVSYQKRVVAKTGSVAIDADSLHYASDVMVNGSVIVAIYLSANLGWELADGLFGIGIAVYVLMCSWEIFRNSLDHLMDRELPDEERQQIIKIVRGHPDVKNLHELKTRTSGQIRFIQLHLEIDGNLSLFRAHEIADEVEALLLEAFPYAEILIHQDPMQLREGEG